MRRIELLTSAFRGSTPLHESQTYLQLMLHALVALDSAYLRFHSNTPPLYGAGVRYRREPHEYEQWLTIPCVHARRWGDCEDLAAWRVAELRAQGVDAWACFHWRKAGRALVYHIVVCRPDGVVEDPSRVLGMGWDEGWKPILAFPRQEVAET
jgi:hypothetical protein